MSIEIKDIELIDRYLDGNLDASSKEAFNARLQSDASFQQLFSDFKSTNELVKANEMAQIKAQLDSFSYDSPSWWQSNTTKILGVVGVAAVVTTAVWMSSSDNKPAATEKVTVTQTAPSNENSQTAISSQEKSSVSSKPLEQRTIVIQHPADYSPQPLSTPAQGVTPNTNLPIKDENTAPQPNPVPTPSGPAVLPPQQVPVASPSIKDKTPDPAPQPLVPQPQETPVVKNFYLQLPNQNWVYPDYMKNGSLHIVNESGAVMNDLNLNSSSDSWNGTDRYGNTVPSGLYFYQYTDATSGKIYSGSITVVY